jgi:hypothetical protein
MPADSPASFHQITDVLSRSLQQAFDEVCPKRYGAPLELQRIDDPADDQTVSFGLDGPEDTALQIDVAIVHVGGNVYDIATQVEDGAVRRFTYSEPASSGSSLSIAPYLGKKIARHVLDEVEQRLGKKVLRGQMTPETT